MPDRDLTYRRVLTRSARPHETIELGHEPPLNIYGASEADLDRRVLNVRWLSGTVLTGFCGALLIAGAMAASIDRLDRRAMTPEIVQPPAPRVSSASERLANAARKSDKITLLADAFSTTKQILRIPMSVKVGDKEIFRVRPHTRINADLAQTLSGSYDIPPFNPLKLMTGDTAVEAETPNDLSQEAEATVVMRDLSTVKIEASTLVEIPPGDVLIQVREAALAKALAQPITLAAPLADEAAANENNTLSVLKSPVQTANTTRSAEKIAQAKTGDTITTLLIEQGTSRDDARAIASIMSRDGRVMTLKEGQALRTLFTPSPGGKVQPARIILSGPNGMEAQVALSDQGRYVSVGEQLLPKPKLRKDESEESEEDEEDNGSGLRLYAAIYESAMRQDMPKAIIDELIRLYAQDVDFTKRVNPGDRFEVFFVSDEDGEGSRGDILYASITVGGELHRYYRFQPKDDNVADYYDEKGKLARKFLLRKPIAGGTLRSTFGMRRHPILRYTRLHSGVDWSDRVGTPIVAAGNGIVVKAGWASGYGRRVELQHANGYVTTYNHMSGFGRGVSEGARVRQGQVIGYLGNTGLSTGPHLHYEVLINNEFQDPLSIRLPRGRELEGRALTEFNAERERINQVMNKDPATSRLLAGGKS